MKFLLVCALALVVAVVVGLESGSDPSLGDDWVTPSLVESLSDVSDASVTAVKGNTPNGFPAMRTCQGCTTMRDPLGRSCGQVLNGPVYTVLQYVIRQFHARVEPIQAGQCGGHNYRANQNSAGTLSNHASGTAIDLNHVAHPNGRRNTFSAAKQVIIRQILAECEGVIRWGGTYTRTADDMHFEIDQPLARVAALANKITSGGVGRTSGSTSAAGGTSAAVSVSAALPRPGAACGAGGRGLCTADVRWCPAGRKNAVRNICQGFCCLPAGVARFADTALEADQPTSAATGALQPTPGPSAPVQVSTPTVTVPVQAVAAVHPVAADVRIPVTPAVSAVTSDPALPPDYPNPDYEEQPLPVVKPPLPVVKSGTRSNSGCTSRGGKCQVDTLACTGGGYQSNLCPASAANVRCCLPASSVASVSPTATRATGLCGTYVGSRITQRRNNAGTPVDVVAVLRTDLSTPSDYGRSETEKDNAMTLATACAFHNLREAARAAGHSIKINSAMRSRARQEYFYNCMLTSRCNIDPRTGRGRTAATPGRSNHGAGIALDLNVGGYTSPAYRWMVANAERLGWVRTVGPQKGNPRTADETWHWEYRPGTTQRASLWPIDRAP